jgi:dTMP kinase
MRVFVFEGIKGSGKTTLIKLVARKLTELPIIEEPPRKLLTLREPGATPLGKMLRDYMQANPELSMETKMHLFLAARAETIDVHLKPIRYESPEPIVLIDRWTESTIAYNGPQYAQQAHAVVGEDHPWSQPYTFFLNATPETCAARISERTKDDDLIVNTAEVIAFERYLVRYGGMRPTSHRFHTVLNAEKLSAEELADFVTTKIMEIITWH